MKVICIITPNLGKGGLERFLSIITSKLVEDFSVVIITLVDNKVEYSFHSDIKIIHLNTRWEGSILKTFMKLLRNVRALKPDVLLGFSEVFNPLTILVAKLSRIKVFISDRSNPLLEHRFRDRLARSLLYPLAEGIIAQTILAKEVLSSKGFNNNIAVIPNPLIDFRNSNIDPSLQVIVTTGRLETTKNQKEILDIFKRLDRKDWTLIMVGDGIERAKLNDKIEALGLGEQVKIVGKQDDIEFWLRKGSVYVYTSLTEGFPNALSEALASPLATIAYDCPAGVSDLIEDDVNGFLIPLGDQDLFVEKLNMLLDDEGLRRRLMTESIKLRDKYHVTDIVKKIKIFIGL